MTRAATRICAAFALGTTIAAPLVAFQPPTDNAAAEPPKPVAFRDVPAFVRKCDNCHFYTRDPLEDADGKKRYWVGPHWRWDVDPHRRASEALDGPLGAEMHRLLAKHSRDPDSWKGGVRTDRRCTSCHGGANADYRAGLSCYDCHQQPAADGATEPNYQWVASHQDERWRKLAPEVKRSRGFRPLHDGMARANGCLSCHVGDAAAGRFVTHEMFAAGHPPLVGVELAKFSEDAYTEKHWLPASDPIKKSYGVPAEDEAKFRAQLSVQGAITALLVQSDVAAAAGKSDSKHAHIAWGDYAFFDCAACHHELAEKSWRRKRAEGGPRATGSKEYGRPPLLEWPAAAALAVHGESLWSSLDEFRFAATETPFGNAAKVAEASRKLRQTLAAAAPKFSEPADWRKLLRQTLALGSNHDFDFDSARQIAWLAESLAKSLGEKDPLAKAVLAGYPKLPFVTEPRALPRWIRPPDGKSKGDLPKLDAPDRLAGLDVLIVGKRKYDPATFREWCKNALAAAPPSS